MTLDLDKEVEDNIGILYLYYKSLIKLSRVK